MNDNHVPRLEAPDDEPRARNVFDTFLNHQKRAADEASKALDALIPPGFKEHGAEAGREFVKGFKVLVDAAINELEKVSKEIEKRSDESDRPSTTGPTKVKVQVE